MSLLLALKGLLLEKVEERWLFLSTRSRRRFRVILFDTMIVCLSHWSIRLRLRLLNFVSTFSWFVVPFFEIVATRWRLWVLVIGPADKALPTRLNMDLMRALQERIAPDVFTPPGVYDGRKNFFSARKLPLGPNDTREASPCFCFFSGFSYTLFVVWRYPRESRRRSTQSRCQRT